MPAYCFAAKLLQGRDRELSGEHAKCGRTMFTRKITLAGTTRGRHKRAQVRYDFDSRGVLITGPYADAVTRTDWQ
jgi:hypothetical protein